MPLQLAIFDSWNDLSPDQWEALMSTQSLSQSFEWQSNAPRPGEWKWIVAMQDGQPVAGMILDIIRTPSQAVDDHPAELLFGERIEGAFQHVGGAQAEKQLERMTRFRQMDYFPFAITRSPHGLGSALYGSAEQTEAMDLVIRGAWKLAAEEGVKVVMHQDLTAPDDILWMERLQAHEAIQVYTACGCSIHVQWKSLPEYMKWIHAHSVRKEYRRLQERTNRYSSIVLPAGESLPPELREEVVELIRANVEKYGSDVPDDFYHFLLTDWPGTRFLSLAKSPEGQVEGTCLSLLRGKELAAAFWGARGRTHDYAMLGLFMPLEFAMEQGAEKISLGMGLYPPKLHRGADMRWTFSFLHFPDFPETTELKDYLQARDQLIQRFFQGIHDEYHRPKNLDSKILGDWPAS